MLPLEETQLNEADTGSLTREAAALAKFQHPNVVTIFGFEEDEDGPFVVTELIKGENLKVIIEKGALSVRVFQEFVSQTLDAMIAAEQMNLLHRDIKPANLMLLFLPSRKFQVKILDFGLAKFSQTPSAQTLDHKGSFLGSIDYIAPEQIERQPLDQRTDLYSLGCVCYFALTQKPPFEGKNLAETMNNHLNHKVIPIADIRPDLPSAIGAWVMRLIAVNPNHRPKNVTAAVTEFEQSKIGITSDLPGGDDSSNPISGSAPIAVTPAPSSTPATSPQSAPPSKETGTQSMTKDGRKILTQPMAGLPTRTSSIDLSPARTGSTRTQTKAQSESEKKMGGPVAILIAAVVLGIGGLIYIFGIRGGDESAPPEDPIVASPVDDPSPKPKAPEKEKSEGDLPQLSLKPPVKPTQKMVQENKLPVSSDDLAGHFVTSEMIFQLDQKTKAKPGDRVGSWGNFVREDGKPVRFLARSYNDKDGSYCPRVVLAAPSQFSELNGPQTLIRFEEDTTLTIPFNLSYTDELAGTKMTCVMVCEISVDQGPLMRIQSKGTNQSVNILPKGKRIEVSVKTSDETSNVRGAYDKRGAFGVLTYTRDGNSHEITIIDSEGKRYNSGKQPCMDSALMLEGFAIGVSPVNRWGDAQFAGHVAELAVFGRALSIEERKATEEHLLAKYFRPKNAQVKGPKGTGAGKQTSKAPVISDSPKALESAENPTSNDHGVPLPPHAASLAAHFSTQGWVFGEGFSAPAEVGDKVYSWGNLTPGAGKHHLLSRADEKYEPPLLALVKPSQSPEFKNVTQVLRFKPGNSLVTPKVKYVVDHLSGDQMTLVVLSKPEEREKNRFLKFDAFNEKDEKKPVRAAYNMITNPNIFGATMRVDKNWLNSSGRRKPGKFFIYTSTWNGGTGELNVVSRDHEGKRIKGNPQPNASKGNLNVIRYALGHDAINAKDNGYAGDVVELLIFKQLLSEEQIVETEKWLAERYFK